MNIKDLSKNEEKAFLIYVKEVLPKMLGTSKTCISGVTKFDIGTKYHVDSKNIEKALTLGLEFDRNPSLSQKKIFIQNLLNFDKFMEEKFNKKVDADLIFPFALSTLLHFQIKDIQDLPLVKHDGDLRYLSSISSMNEMVKSLKDSKSKSNLSFKYLMFNTAVKNPLEIRNESRLDDVLSTAYLNYEIFSKLDGALKPLTLEMKKIILKSGLNEKDIVSITKDSLVTNKKFRQMFFKAYSPGNLMSYLSGYYRKSEVNSNVISLVACPDEGVHKKLKLVANSESVERIVIDSLMNSVMKKEDNEFLKGLLDSDIQTLKSMFYYFIENEDLKSVEKFREYKEIVVGIEHLTAVELGKFVDSHGWGKESDVPLITEILDGASKEKLAKVVENFNVSLATVPENWVFDFLIDFKKKDLEKNSAFVDSIFQSVLLDLPLNQPIDSPEGASITFQKNFKNFKETKAFKHFNAALDFTEMHQTAELIEHLTVYAFTKFPENEMLKQKERLKALDSKTYHNTIGLIATTAQAWHNSDYDGGKNKITVCGKPISSVLIKVNVNYKNLLLLLADNLEDEMNKTVQKNPASDDSGFGRPLKL